MGGRASIIFMALWRPYLGWSGWLHRRSEGGKPQHCYLAPLGWCAQWPVGSTLVLLGFLAPVALAVAYSNQLPNQIFLAFAGGATGLWMWYSLHPFLNCAEGYGIAGFFVAIFLLGVWGASHTCPTFSVC